MKKGSLSSFACVSLSNLHNFSSLDVIFLISMWYLFEQIYHERGQSILIYDRAEVVSNRKVKGRRQLRCHMLKLNGNATQWEKKKWKIEMEQMALVIKTYYVLMLSFILQIKKLKLDFNRNWDNFNVIYIWEYSSKMWFWNDRFLDSIEKNHFYIYNYKKDINLFHRLN